MLGLSPLEIVIIAVVAVIAFGPRLPHVAAEAAHVIGRMRRSLAELRRETGIDQEIAAARRSLESAVPREVRTLDVPGTVRRKVREVQGEVSTLVKEAGEEDAPKTPGASGAESPLADRPADPTGPDRP